MALSGTIQDFGLGDIFQLIGIQRKTGVLKLESDRDTVTIKFLEGQVVGADTRSASVEDLLGAVLVRTGKITDDQRARALGIQKKTLQRLGHILVKQGFINEDELVEALRVQSLQIVYRLFRWRAGRYEFAAAEELDYDERHFEPISAETILMEGARMIDEWPIIERRIRSDDMVVRLTDEGLAAHTSAPPAQEPGVEDLDFDFSFDRQAEEEVALEAPADEGPQLDPEQRVVLGLVDGERSVQEINDHANLGEFDTYRVLAELMSKGLIEEVKAPVVPLAARRGLRVPDKLVHAVAGLVLLGLGALSLATLPTNRWTPWRLGLADPATGQLHRLAGQERLERVEQALKTYYLDHGSYPDALEPLAWGRYLRHEELSDPWGRAYAYELSAGGWRLSGTDAAGEPDPQYRVTHRFTAVERMMQQPAAE